MSRRDLWKALYERFEPESPANSRWRAERPDSPAQQIIDSLELQLGTPRAGAGPEGHPKAGQIGNLTERQRRVRWQLIEGLRQQFAQDDAD